MDKVPDVVIPGDDPLNRVTDHIDIDWHVQVKPEWCKNEETKGRGLQRGSCNTYSAIILADRGIAHMLASCTTGQRRILGIVAGEGRVLPCNSGDQ